MGRCVSFHRFCGLLFLILFFAPFVYAKAPGTPRTESAVGKQAANPSQTNSVEYTLPQERYEKAVAYSRASYTLYFISVFLTVLVLLLILRLGIAARVRDWAESVSGQRWVQGLLFGTFLVATVVTASLPVHLYGHALSLRYEMSVQGWGSWFLDWGKEQLLTLGLGLLLVMGLSAVLRKSPRRWWFFAWLAALPVVLFFVFIAPWFIDPLFNKFEPLRAEHAELVAAIEKVAQHAGVPIPADRMYLMKASEKTNAIDAYVTGLGASKRVVIWDTTIQKATTSETIYIVGHELGHYVLGHIWKGFLFSAGLLLIGFYALFRVLHWALDHWSGDWRIYGQEDWAAFAALALFLEIGMFLAMPVINGYSRMQEHAADVYGLEVIHGIIPDSAEVAAKSFQVLGEEDLADPNPPAFITFWLYSHPPIAERLVFAHNYDPWSAGQSPKYVK